MLLRMKEVNSLQVLHGYMDSKIEIEAVAQVGVPDAKKGKRKGARGGSAREHEQGEPQTGTESIRKKSVESGQKSLCFKRSGVDEEQEQ